MKGKMMMRHGGSMVQAGQMKMGAAGKKPKKLSVLAAKMAQMAAKGK